MVALPYGLAGQGALPVDHAKADVPIELRLPGPQGSQHRCDVRLRGTRGELVLERVGDLGRCDVNGERHRVGVPATEEEHVALGSTWDPVGHEGQIVRV